MTSTVFVDEQTVIRASWLNDVNADVYGVRPVSTGGTGASDAATARTNLGLGNVDNTSDADKPVSTATQTALNLKFDKSGGTVTGNMTVTGNAALGDAEASDTHAIKGATTVLANSASAALTVTQTGAGNAFVVEDSASTDSTPFVIDQFGRVILGATQAYNATGGYTAGFSQYAVNGESTFGRFSNDTNATFIDITKSRGASLGVHTIVQSNDTFGRINFAGSDGTNFIVGAQINSQVDGTPGTNDMPGRLVFSTTADGASSPTERMRIDSTGAVGISTALPQVSLYNTRNISGNATSYGFYEQATVQSDVTSAAFGYRSNLSTAAAAFTLASHYNYYAGQGTIGAGSAITNQYGFVADSTLTGATNNYGFYSNIAAAANRYNFYAAGTAGNYFAGDVQLGKTVTAGGTTGAQTINKTVGTVNFAAAATSLVVTNSLVTANSIIVATVATNDATMKSVLVVAAAGSFTLHANAAATAETRVNFCVFN